MIDKTIHKIRNNIFLISAFISLVLFSYIFLSLIGSGYFYEKIIIIFSSFILIFWFFLCIIFELKNNHCLRISKITIFSILSGLFLGFYYVKHIWFSGYLNLDPIKAFLEGETHLDTILHADIAESYISNGYPSIQFNNSSYLHYHTISHFILGNISKLIRVPALITYNFLYPLIFIPCYVFLVQIVVITFRKKFAFENVSYSKDIILLICFCLGFNFFSLSDKGCFWYNSIIDSESCFVSCIFMLLYFFIIFSILDKTTALNIISAFIITPLFIFIITGAKVSTGLIFYLAISYYVFRNKPISIKTWIFIIFNGLIFLLNFKIFNDSINKDDQTSIFLFYFLHSFVEKKFWLLHYIIYIMPFIFIFRYNKSGILFSKEYFSNKKNIWIELIFLLTIGSWLPGILLKIDGGNSEYFCYPAFIISILIFIGTNTHSEIYKVLEKKNNFYFFIICVLSISLLVNNKLISFFLIIVLILLSMDIPIKDQNLIYKLKKIDIKKITIILFLFISLFIPELKKINIKNTIHETITISNKEQLDLMSKSYAFYNRLKKLDLCFHRSMYIEDKRYQTFYEIRNLVNKNQDLYCIYISDNCYLFDLYNITDSPQYTMKSVMSAACLYGIPVINAMYNIDSNIYRSDGLKIKTGPLYYGLRSVNMNSKKLSIEESIQNAKSFQKKYMIVLYEDSYIIKNIEE